MNISFGRKAPFGYMFNIDMMVGVSLSMFIAQLRLDLRCSFMSGLCEAAANRA